MTNIVCSHEQHQVYHSDLTGENEGLREAEKWKDCQGLEMRCVNMLGWMRKTKRDCAVGEWMTKVNNEYMNWATYERGEPERASSLGNVTQPRQQRGTERQQRSTEGQQRGTEGQQRGTERGWSHGWTWVRRGNETDTTDPSNRHLWKISV